MENSKIKITFIYDNKNENKDLEEGWGFSALINHNNHKILFDTGGYHDSFISNISKLDIHLDSITHLVISHCHGDHVAGFYEVIKKIPPSAKIYLPKFFFHPLSLKNFMKKFNSVRSFFQIEPDVYSLVLKGDLGFFLFEQALILDTEKGLIIVTGCAHPGITNIIKSAKKQLSKNIYAVVGGFHLAFSPYPKVKAIVKEFQDLGVKKVVPCHCSGDHAIREFHQTYAENCIRIGTGSAIAL